MVNLKINVLKPHYVTSNDKCHGKDEDTIVHEQIFRVPDSEKLKVLISTDTEIDKIEVFVKNKKEDADAFNSYVDAATTISSPNCFPNLNKPNEIRTPTNIFEEDEDMESKVQDTLARHAGFWRESGENEFAVSVVENGYVFQMWDIPKNYDERNNSL